MVLLQVDLGGPLSPELGTYRACDTDQEEKSARAHFFKTWEFQKQHMWPHGFGELDCENKNSPVFLISGSLV